MANDRIKVEIFYDVVSPYSWIAFEVLCRYRSFWNMDLILRPFFLGGVMKETGNRPPMMLPAKGLYMVKDLERNSSYFGIPLKLMQDPYKTIGGKGSLKAMRFLTAINLNYPEYLEQVSRELWTRIWSKEQDITEDESLRLAAKKAQMSDDKIEMCLKKMDNTDNKEVLARVTDDALKYGAFGAPIIILHMPSGPEMFFGSDRFLLIAHKMGKPWRGAFPEDHKSSL